MNVKNFIYDGNTSHVWCLKLFILILKNKFDKKRKEQITDDFNLPRQGHSMIFRPVSVTSFLVYLFFFLFRVKIASCFAFSSFDETTNSGCDEEMIIDSKEENLIKNAISFSFSFKTFLERANT